MSDNYCRKCGTRGGEADRFCRKCGTVLDLARVSSDQRQPGGQEGNELSSATALPQFALLAIACLALSTLVLVAIFLYVAVSNAPVAVEVIGSATPYPTSTSYRTATPYRTPTPYAPGIPYPTTGPLSIPEPTREASSGTVWEQPVWVVTVKPFGFFAPSCRLNIKNQNPDLDALVILADSETNEIEKAIYVRANDSFGGSGIGAGTYYTYVAVGLNWDATSGAFLYDVGRFRFKDAVVFNTCSSPIYGGSYQYLDVTLNVEAGIGSESISVPWENFPSVAP